MNRRGLQVAVILLLSLVVSLPVFADEEPLVNPFSFGNGYSRRLDGNIHANRG